MLWLIFLLFLFGLYLLLKPIYKIYSFSRRVQRGDFDAFNDLFGQPGAQRSSSAYDNRGRRKAGWTAPGIRRKKINKDVGEYVKFQEIDVTESNTAQSAGGSERYITEEQITDVEWEDVK